MRLDRDVRAEARRLNAAIANIGFVLPGTLSHRHTRCGRAGCHCHADPPQLHGPYWWWTRKLHAKTITRLLTDQQAADYQPWFDNARTLRTLTAELEALTLRIVENDPRSARRPGGRRPLAQTEPAVDKPRSQRH
jgi:hypothetical protein